MTQDLVTEIIRKALLMVLTCAAPMLLAALAVGILVSVFQAVTSISEMTLVFVPKIIAVFITLALFFPWISSALIDFARWIFEGLPTMVR